MGENKTLNHHLINNFIVVVWMRHCTADLTVSSLHKSDFLNFTTTVVPPISKWAPIC